MSYKHFEVIYKSPNCRIEQAMLAEMAEDLGRTKTELLALGVRLLFKLHQRQKLPVKQHPEPTLKRTMEERFRDRFESGELG